MKRRLLRFHQLAISNYGREFGWYVELDGQVIGELVEPVWVDMFWDSYKLVPINGTGSPELYDYENWLSGRFKFRNKITTELIDALPAGGKGGKGEFPNRVTIRGLYLGKESGWIGELALRMYTPVAHLPRAFSNRKT